MRRSLEWSARSSRTSFELWLRKAVNLGGSWRPRSAFLAAEVHFEAHGREAHRVLVPLDRDGGLKVIRQVVRHLRLVGFHSRARGADREREAEGAREGQRGGRHG